MPERQKILTNQKTPSVYFQFDDSIQKTFESKDDVDFAYSSSTQKYQFEQIIHIKPIVVEELQDFNSVERSTGPKQKLKTDEFFEEFDNNFVVMFEDQSLHKKYERQVAAPAQAIMGNEDVQLISQFSANNPKYSLSEVEDHKLKYESLNGSVSFVARQSFGSINNQSKIRESPTLSFDVKKRTAFKNVQNIQSNRQAFKITKKKSINYEQLNILKHQIEFKATTSKYTRKNQPRPFSFTTKLSEKQNCGLKSRESSIFSKNSKPIRSTTLDQWKKRFQIRIDEQRKTVSRLNIFQKPFMLR